MYAHQWTPVAAVVAALIIFTNAYLALIALMVVLLAAVAALGALAWAIVAALYALGSSVPRRWRERSGASQRRPLHPGAAESGPP